MAILNNTSYQPPFFAFNQHMETIIPSALRKVKAFDYDRRERISTPDDDFLDLDWKVREGTKLIILSHGLEGSSDRPYIKGMGKLFHEHNWSILAWNCRSCSGEINRKPLLYHHGFTEDLRLVVEHAISNGFKEIVLAGFSMGGSLTLKYLGENKEQLPSQVKGGVAVSVPCNLSDSSKLLAAKKNRFYQNRFMRKLHKKLLMKQEQYPDLVSIKPWKSFDNFHQFDTHYSAKIYNFKDANDFYNNVQCLPYLKTIEVPTLLLNAWNDPILAPSCYPKEIASNHPYLTLEISEKGGHVGFLQKESEFTYAEERAFEFVESIL